MNLYIEENNQENEKSIVFLHGYSMAGWMWNEQVKAFPDYHCIVPDLPEHGRSCDIRPFNIKNAALEVIDIINEQTQDGKAHLVGMSMGAQVILEILNTAPEVVDHAFISGAVVNINPPSETFLGLLDYLINIYVPAKNDNLSIGSYIRSYGIPRDLIKKFKESTYIIPFESAENMIRESMLFDLPSNLENIDVPVLVMAGEKDYGVIKEHARDLVDTLPNSKAYLAPGVGHMWNMESPELFNQVLNSWIAGQSLPNSLKEI